MGAPPGGGGYGGGGGSLARIPFSAEETATISSMARFMAIAGFLSIAGGVLNLVNVILTMVLIEAPGAQKAMQACGGLIGIAIVAALGGLLIMAGGAFKKVAETDDADQAHLVDGLGKLRTYFVIKSVLIILVVLLVCCAVILGAGAAASLGASRNF
jgi:general stress protein CsbA